MVIMMCPIWGAGDLKLNTNAAFDLWTRICGLRDGNLLSLNLVSPLYPLKNCCHVTIKFIKLSKEINIVLKKKKKKTKGCIHFQKLMWQNLISVTEKRQEKWGQKIIFICGLRVIVYLQSRRQDYGSHSEKIWLWALFVKPHIFERVKLVISTWD